MRLSRMTKVFFAVLLTNAIAFAGNLAGLWNFQMTALDGSTSSPTATLSQRGSTVSGEYSGKYGVSKITGTLDGRDIELETETTKGKLLFHGALDADGEVFSGSFELSNGGGNFSAKRKSQRRK